MMRLLLLIVGIVACQEGFSQKGYKGLPSLIWPKLYDIQYEKANDTFGSYDKPVFGKGAKALDGKEVILPGYMVPFESSTKGTHFMLSATPLNACFFCGVGGPESVVEVFAKAPVSFTEKPIEVKGILRLNASDPEKMIYILEKAEFLGEVAF